MATKKQIKANRENAKNSTGPKTPEGKAIVKYNSVTHGLLAKETVITVGDGAEKKEEYDLLYNGLVEDLKPIGMIEELLVEKIAVAWWRLRRAMQYESGVTSNRKYDLVDDYYGKINYKGHKYHRTDEEISKWIDDYKDAINDLTLLEKKYDEFIHEAKPNTPIFKELEDKFYRRIRDLFKEKNPPNGDHRLFNMVDDHIVPLEHKEIVAIVKEELEWDDERILEELKDICKEQKKKCTEEVSDIQKTIKSMLKEKEDNKQRLVVIDKIQSIPNRTELDLLMRYEGTIEKQLYKALEQLQKLQKRRENAS